MYKNNFVSAIIAAAGMSRRMGLDKSKQFLLIGEKPVIVHTLLAFEKNKYIDEIILVIREDEKNKYIDEVIGKYKFKKTIKLVIGGTSREESVYRGIKNLDKNSDIVVSHDGARPFVRDDIINESIECAYEKGACIVGVPVKDTIKVVENGVVRSTPKRSSLYAIQTPQTFKRDLIESSYEISFLKGTYATDDSGLVEKMDINVEVIMGDYNNIKLTTYEDMIMAGNIFKYYNGGEV